jgi:two-component system, OmpR family, sensor histidine kinase QseC
MMGSLRSRLFIILVSTTSAIWLIAAIWIYVGTKKEVENVLDARLLEAARMVSSLVGGTAGIQPQLGPEKTHATEIKGYEGQLACQIWSFDGRLMARSSGAPDARMSEAPAGFSERQIDGETWRIYSTEDPTNGTRVLVGDRLKLRRHLVAELIKDLLAPTLLIVPILGLLIWTSLNRGLRPLRFIAEELESRGADDLSPLSTEYTPTEIQPLIVAMNGLFRKVHLARQHEREITAFAAHELRTPLAGLQTQAQISIATTDQIVRETALRQILIAAGRASRLVRQLLAISKLDTLQDLPKEPAVNIGQALQEVVNALPEPNPNIQIVLESPLWSTSIRANRELILLAFRNLHENAMNHMSSGGTIRWSVNDYPSALVIAVEDDGPGIPKEELHLVTHRFFRGRHKSAAGSGLGLSIVQLALEANGALLTLSNRTDRLGLRVEATWMKNSDREQPPIAERRWLTLKTRFAQGLANA